jgi:aspartate/methionine/tyrosine aminotransferase
MGISKRAKFLLKVPENSIMEGHNAWAKNPYHKSENPTGIINLSVSQNNLMHDLLIPKINTSLDLGAEHLAYTEAHGIEELRTEFCSFLQTHLGLNDLNPENLIIQSGATPLCENLSFSLFDEGDYLLTPAPYFPGFDHTFTKRFGANIVKAPLSSQNNFTHDIESIIETYQSFEFKSKLKAILITQPHNPTGEILSKAFLNQIVKFAKENNLEIISDEIYALSTHWQVDHQSLFELAKSSGVKAHFIYGMAKDFSLPSFKVGVYYSEDQEVVKSMKRQSYFAPVSIQTQALALNILKDHLFLTQFKTLNQERLNKTLRRIKSELSDFNFIPSDAGLFTILDLSEYCSNFKDEDKLFKKILNELKVNITKGKEFGFNRPGYFRLCFAHPEDVVKELCSRLKRLNHD